VGSASGPALPRRSTNFLTLKREKPERSTDCRLENPGRVSGMPGKGREGEIGGRNLTEGRPSGSSTWGRGGKWGGGKRVRKGKEVKTQKEAVESGVNKAKTVRGGSPTPGNLKRDNLLLPSKIGRENCKKIRSLGKGHTWGQSRFSPVRRKKLLPLCRQRWAPSKEKTQKKKTTSDQRIKRR